MKIFKNIAVRIIPAGALAFIIFAAIAYQRGVYDFTFIERPTSSSTTARTDTTDKITSSDTTETESDTAAETEPPVKTDPITELLNRLESTASALASGYKVTDAEYSHDTKLTLLETSLTIPNNYSLRTKTVTLPQRVRNEIYGGYTTKTSTSEVSRPLVDIYMDYILVDDGSYVSVLNSEGNILYAGFDIDYVQPAYTRDKNDIPQFKALIPAKNAREKPTLKYYMFDKDGGFVESKYNDAADNRGIYINYPSYYGKTDNSYYRYYKDGFYGYGNANGTMRTQFRYTDAYNYSEGVAAAVNEEGVLNYIQQWFYNQITGTKTYRNLSYRRVTSNYHLPDTRGIESLGFFYFEHGLCRVRKREVDAFYTDRILTDIDIVIRLDGKEFPVPSDYEVVSYSCGILLLEKDGLYGCMDYTGKWIAQPIYDNAEPFSEGLGVLGKDSKLGMIDTEGNFVIPMVFDRISSASGGIITAWDVSNGWSIFNKVEMNG